MAAKKLIITQVRSGNRCPSIQRRTLKALGLGKIRRTVELPANDAVLGMARAVDHLITVKRA